MVKNCYVSLFILAIQVYSSLVSYLDSPTRFFLLWVYAVPNSSQGNINLSMRNVRNAVRTRIMMRSLQKEISEIPLQRVDIYLCVCETNCNGYEANVSLTINNVLPYDSIS